MASNTLNAPAPETSVTGLVSGIVSDAQDLLKQQVALVQAEVRADVRRSLQASAVLAAGAVALVPATLMLCQMLVYLLHEQAGFSRWASYGIVGGVAAALGAGLLAVGVARFRSFNPLPDQSAEALKENVRWLTNPK